MFSVLLGIGLAVTFLYNRVTRARQLTSLPEIPVSSFLMLSVSYKTVLSKTHVSMV